MDFTLVNKQSLNKNDILSKVSEEQIFSFYLRRDIQNKKLFRSPLRNDKNPTCSMFRNNSGTVIFKDFATGDYLNCFGFVMKLFNCSYHEALDIIANDFNICYNPLIKKNKGKIVSKDVKVSEKETSEIQVQIQDFTENELKWWGKYGITLDILNKYNVYSCKYVWLNKQLFNESKQHFPIFGYYGSKYQGKELWRIYYPKTKNSFKFMGNWPSKKIQGYEQLPKKGNLLIITKSLKDVMCLHSLGIAACAPCSETQFLSDSMLSELKQRFKYIVTLFDNDSTGISFMNKQKKKHPELLYTWIPRSLGAKDISDYHKENGRKKTSKLIADFIKYCKQTNKL